MKALSIFLLVLLGSSVTSCKVASVSSNLAADDNISGTAYHFFSTPGENGDRVLSYERADASKQVNSWEDDSLTDINSLSGEINEYYNQKPSDGRRWEQTMFLAPYSEGYGNRGSQDELGIGIKGIRYPNPRQEISNSEIYSIVRNGDDEKLKRIMPPPDNFRTRAPYQVEESLERANQYRTDKLNGTY